jgi:hypothetical protein
MLLQPLLVMRAEMAKPEMSHAARLTERTVLVMRRDSEVLIREVTLGFSPGRAAKRVDAAVAEKGSGNCGRNDLGGGH